MHVLGFVPTDYASVPDVLRLLPTCRFIHRSAASQSGNLRTCSVTVMSNSFHNGGLRSEFESADTRGEVCLLALYVLVVFTAVAARCAQGFVMPWVCDGCVLIISMEHKTPPFYNRVTLGWVLKPRVFTRGMVASSMRSARPLALTQWVRGTGVCTPRSYGSWTGVGSVPTSCIGLPVSSCRLPQFSTVVSGAAGFRSCRPDVKPTGFLFA